MSEMEEQPAKRRPGRPSKPEGEAKRSFFQTRIREGVRQRIEAAAAEKGRSLSEEIERRLEMSLDPVLPEEDRQLMIALGATYRAGGLSALIRLAVTTLDNP